MFEQNESKMAQIAEALGKATWKVDVKKMARKFGVKPTTVFQVARMNPGQCDIGWDNNRQVITVHSADLTTKTDHNLRYEGQPANSFRCERLPRKRISHPGKVSARKLSNG